MKIATWNVERLKHRKDLDVMLREIEKAMPDILVLTETDIRLHPEYPHYYQTPLLQEYNPEYYRDTENRVSVFTKYRCVKKYETYDRFTVICVELETENGNLLVYGTIMGIFGNREKSFKPDLEKQMDDIRKLSADGMSICVIGDYNLSFCDNYYYTNYGRELVQDTFSDCGIKMLTRETPECIDHIAVSEKFIGEGRMSLSEWNYDKALSDHKGTLVEIKW